jgi:hypothetical protein
VFDSSGALVGMVATPLCISGYELPAVIPVAALAAAVSASLPELPSICQQPASSTAATAACRELPCCSLNPQQTQLRRAEPAAHIECGACSAAAGATTLPGAVPAVSARSGAERDAAAIQQATRGVVGCSLSSGQWASGILVNRCCASTLCKADRSWLPYCRPNVATPQRDIGHVGSVSNAWCRWGTVLTNAHLFDGVAASRSAHITVTAQSVAGLQQYDAAVLHIFSGAFAS